MELEIDTEAVVLTF